MAVNLSLLAMVLVLLPMLYLLLASPAFLFVRLDIPQVARLLRAMFHGYFMALIATASLGVGLNLIDSRTKAALVLAGLVALVVLWRRWLLTRFDRQLADLQGEPARVARRLRHLHIAGMAANALQVAALTALVPVLVNWI